MSDITEINQRRFFTLDEARQLLPLVKRITRQAHDDIDRMGTQLSYCADKKMKHRLETEIQSTFDDWASKLKKLGAEVKGMWLVDFDNGEGYYCWNYPESDICHYHTYNSGFSGRVKLDV